MGFPFRALLFFALLSGLSSQAFGQDKVVYHLDGGLEQATRALVNIRNQLEVDPKAKIVVVALDRGVDFLLDGAKDRFGDYDARAQDLMGQGVKFEVCEITMRARNLKKDQFILGVEFVPSGVVRITHLQQREGYAYLKP